MLKISRVFIVVLVFSLVALAGCASEEQEPEETLTSQEPLPDPIPDPIPDPAGHLDGEEPAGTALDRDVDRRATRQRSRLRPVSRPPGPAGVGSVAAGFAGRAVRVGASGIQVRSATGRAAVRSET